LKTLSAKDRPHLLESLFLAFLLVSQVYYSYRYPLKYDSTTTSPTYADTPVVFQAVKYVLAMAFFGASVAVIAASGGRTRRVSDNVVFFLFFVSGFVAYCLALGITFLGAGLAQAGDIFVFRGFFFFPLLALVPFHYAGNASLRRYLWVILGFGCTFHVIYSVIQLVAYFGFGRLPALGYEGGLVRFGGGWDDPNGFGGFLVLPLMFLFSDAFFRPVTRLALAAVLVPLLALTTSMTGVGALLCATLFYSVLRARVLWIIGVAVTVLAILANSTVRELLLFVYEKKQESMESHWSTMSVVDFFSGANLVEILFGQHGAAVIPNESFYVALTENYGCVGLIWFVSIVAVTAINAALKAGVYEAHGDHRYAEILRVLAAFVVGLSIASTGIAFYYVFPINLYLWLAIFLLWLIPGVRSRELETASVDVESSPAGVQPPRLSSAVASIGVRSSAAERYRQQP
jgi:hypothetical protein